MNEFDYYQTQARRYAKYRSSTYPFMAIAEEVGELVGPVAKQVRKHGSIHGVDKSAAQSEVGDVLWNLAAICDELGLSLGDCASHNLVKLNEREEQGTIDAVDRNKEWRKKYYDKNHPLD